jgi:antitoxin YefM
MRNKMKDYFDRVTDDCETVIVTRKGEKNVVLISLDEYNNLMENNFITGNKAYYDRLLKSKSQLEQGQVNELDESALNDE